MARSDKALVVLDAYGPPETNFEVLNQLCQKYGGKLIPLLFWYNIRTEDGRLKPVNSTFSFKIPERIGTYQDEEEGGQDRKDWFDNTVFLHRSVIRALAASLDSVSQPATNGQQQRRPQPQQNGEQMLSDTEWHFDKWNGRHKIVFGEWKWTFYTEDGKPEDEVSLSDMEIVVERFQEENKGSKVRVVSYSPEAEYLLERAGCLSSYGYFEGNNFSFGDPRFLLGVMCRRDFGNFMKDRKSGRR